MRNCWRWAGLEYINKISDKFHFQSSIRLCLSLMAWFLTRVLAGFLLVQVLLGFLLLRESLVSGNQGLLVNVRTGRKHSWKEGARVQPGGVCAAYSRQRYDTQHQHRPLVSGYQRRIVFPSYSRSDSAHTDVITYPFTFDFMPRECTSAAQKLFGFGSLFWFSKTINALCTAANVVLSQMLSCMMISCALALIVIFSLVFEAHFGFLVCVSQTFLISVRQR